MSDAHACLICLEEITQPLLLPCNHSDVCIRCFLTMSQCYGTRTCPCCQSEVTEDPIITDTIHPVDYRVELLKNYSHDEKFRVFYKDESVLQQLQSMMTFHCSVCHQEFTSFKQFTKHTNGVHHRRVCKICSRAHRSLPSQVETFNAVGLKKHMKVHPKCPCCDFIAFDDVLLSEHVREQHFRCEVCAAEGKVVWFPNADLLRVHFHECHYACEDPMCVEQGFIVFATPLELQLHMASVHGERAPVSLDMKRSSEPDEKQEQRKRAEQARKSLSAILRSTFPGDKSIGDKVFRLLDAYQSRGVKPRAFLAQLQEMLGDKADYLFCNIAAAVRNPRLRGDLVRERSGIRPCKLPGRPRPNMTEEDFPMLGDAPQQPETPQTQEPSGNPGRKGKGRKKIVLLSF